MEAVKRIKPTKKARRSSYSSSTEYTIKEMLVQAGYSEKEIRRLRDEDRIFITPSNLASKLKLRQELVIVDEYRLLTPPDKLEDRFEDLEEE